MLCAINHVWRNANARGHLNYNRGVDFLKIEIMFNMFIVSILMLSIAYLYNVLWEC